MIIEELHWSDLKRMAQSPMHVRYGIENRTKPAPAMLFGTLVHSLVLGGDVVVYEGERRGNAWKDFAAAHEGRTVVTASEAAEARLVADAVLRDPVAAPLLVGQHEVAWKTKMHGRICAGRIDVAGPNTVELKTTNDASPHRFSWQCRRMCYASQLGWYADARIAMGQNPGDAYIIGVETKAPYPVTVLRVTGRALEEGRRLNRLWLERLAACEAADEWPGYVQSVVELDIAEDDEALIIDGEEVAA